MASTWLPAELDYIVNCDSEELLLFTTASYTKLHLLLFCECYV